MNTNRKRFAIVAATSAVVLVGGGVAVAYWTATGAGSGSAKVGNTTAFVITQTNSVTGLVPGGPAQPLDFDVTNNGGGVQQISGVTISVSDTGNASCDAADFVVTQPTFASRTINGGATSSFPSTATGADISMKNTGVSQDACKGATLELTYTSN